MLEKIKRSITTLIEDLLDNEQSAEEIAHQVLILINQNGGVVDGRRDSQEETKVS